MTGRSSVVPREKWSALWTSTRVAGERVLTTTRSVRGSLLTTRRRSGLACWGKVLGNAGSDCCCDDHTADCRTTYPCGVGMDHGNGVFRAVTFCNQTSITDVCDNKPSQPPIRFADILDGLSTMVAIGESPFLLYADCAVCVHFSLYHDDFDYMNGIDFSEALGSLYFPIHSHRTVAAASNDELEMSIGSYHRGGANVTMCDGSVQLLTENIDAQVRLAIGSRAGREVVQAGDL